MTVEQPAREPSIPPPSAEHMAVNLIGWHKCESGEEWFTDVFGFGADMPSLIGLIRRAHAAETQLAAIDAIMRDELGKEACPECHKDGERFRCSCSYPHPPHDWCDGVPCKACNGTGTRDVIDGLTLVQGVERVVAKLQEEIGCTEAMKEGFGERLWSVEAERDAARAAVVEMREAAAVKIEEQSKMLSSMFDDRHEPLCRDLAAAIRSLPVKEG